MRGSARRDRLVLRAGLALLAAGLGALGASLWWSADSEADAVRIEVADADLERGAVLYAEHCASCHGAELEGQPDWRKPGPGGRLPAPPHDATGHTWHHADDVLFRIVRDGTAAVVGGGYESDMPGFGDALSDAEIRDILAHIKSTWPERQRTYQAQVTAQGRR